jgi:hypothetical protein
MEGVVRDSERTCLLTCMDSEYFHSFYTGCLALRVSSNDDT